MDRLLAARETALRLLPRAMLDIIKGSPDFRPLEPGGDPAWLQIAAEGSRSTELVIYRSRLDHQYYVIAPETGELAI